MAEEDIRYWARVGMYVTREFAEEWIEKISSGETSGGQYLDNEVEEYNAIPVHSPRTLKSEVEELFNNPFEEHEIASDIQAIIEAEKMERNRVSRIKELRAEGLDLSEAKQQAQQEIDERVAEILGVELGAMSIGMGTEADTTDTESEVSESDDNAD